jgi:p-aminobenzoyl-glutamate transporter AbgT
LICFYVEQTLSNILKGNINKRENNSQMTQFKKIISLTAIILVVLQMVAMLLSWIITAAIPVLQLHSMLSSEGIRWFFGHFASNIASPLLVYIIISGIAFGAIIDCGLMDLIKQIRNHDKLSYRQRFAMYVVIAEICIFSIVIILLTCIPHAILLSVTGNIFPSSFSKSIIPVICFIFSIIAVTYGWINGRYIHMYDIIKALSLGICKISPLFIIYILLTEFICSIIYII